MLSDGITGYISHCCNNEQGELDEITYLTIYIEHLNENENGVRLNQKKGALLL